MKNREKSRKRWAFVFLLLIWWLTMDPTIHVNAQDVQVSKQTIIGKAMSLPKPYYPKKAKRKSVGGVVPVRVIISEQGKVIYAKAVTGNKDLLAAAEWAARKSAFEPTILSGQPVKVSGIITYNFVPK